MIRLPARVVPLLVTLALDTGASAQSAAQEPAGEMRARAMGVLTYTTLSVDLERVPARKAFQAVATAIGIPIIGRYNDDDLGYGLDPELPVTVRIDDVPAEFVLEMILEQCAIDVPCTWQIRKGYLEVGTKDRLSVPAAIEKRTYPVGDLLIEPPYFESTQAMAALSWMRQRMRPQRIPAPRSFATHEYRSAALSRPGPRKTSDQAMGEIVEGIVEMIEPGNWDYGQFGENEDAAGPRPVRIARLRIWRDSIVVSAPDYIHRRIQDITPIPPAPLSAAEIADRSARASSPGLRVVVVGPVADLPGQGARR